MGTVAPLGERVEVVGQRREEADAPQRTYEKRSLGVPADRGDGVMKQTSVVFRAVGVVLHRLRVKIEAEQAVGISDPQYFLFGIKGRDG